MRVRPFGATLATPAGADVISRSATFDDEALQRAVALASADETTAKRVASLVGDANGARGHMQGLVNGTVRARESINARPGAVLRIFEQKTMDKVGSNPGQTGVGK